MENKNNRSELSNNKRPVSATMPTMRAANHTQATRPVETARPVAAKPVAPVKPAETTAPKASAPSKPVTNIAANKPAATSKPVTVPTNSREEKSAKSKKKNKKMIFAFGLILLIALIALAAFLIINNANKGDGEGEEIPPYAVTTEEEKKITKEVLDKYTEITVEGYKEINNNPVAEAAVIVSVKNISNETVSLAIVMAAMDENDNVLETSSIYAEGIEPGQTHTFETFVYTSLTPDQLKNAKYKAYKASTYETPTPSGESGEQAVEEEQKPEGEEATESETE